MKFLWGKKKTRGVAKPAPFNATCLWVSHDAMGLPTLETKPNGELPFIRKDVMDIAIATRVKQARKAKPLEWIHREGDRTSYTAFSHLENCYYKIFEADVDKWFFVITKHDYAQFSDIPEYTLASRLEIDAIKSKYDIKTIDGDIHTILSKIDDAYQYRVESLLQEVE